MAETAHDPPPPMRAFYGWKPQPVDNRDFLQPTKNLAEVALDSAVNLTETTTWPVVYNQGALNSCTSNATAAIFEWLTIKEANEPDFMPSRLFIYYNARVMEDTVEDDSGVYIRDAMACLAKTGVCSEDIWPYDSVAGAQDPPYAWPEDARGGLKPDPTC